MAAGTGTDCRDAIRRAGGKGRQLESSDGIPIIYRKIAPRNAPLATSGASSLKGLPA
jgi:hypothetical protein